MSVDPPLDLIDLAKKLVSTSAFENFRVYPGNPTPFRVRGRFHGMIVFDAPRAFPIWEHLEHPQYYIERQSFLQTLEMGPCLTDSQPMSSLGHVFTMKLTVDTRTISNILYFDKDCLQSGLADLVRVPFGEIDEWFEEDMRIYKHPKSPYHRVDVLESNRYIDVLLEDTMLARADTFLFLLETGRPATFYLPPDSVVDEQYLTQTMVKKGCPYKGQAWYMDVTVNGRVYRELAWKYATQTGATLRLARHICFDRDRVVFRWGQGNPPESTNWG